MMDDNHSFFGELNFTNAQLQLGDLIAIEQSTIYLKNVGVCV
jgi:hypothetical protein